MKHILASLILTAAAAHAETLLFIDDHEVLYRSGTRAVVQALEKFTGNPVVTPAHPELPWEKSIQWVSVHRDEKSGKMQMWYQVYVGGMAEDKRFNCVVAYAESSDGLAWVKPKLTLFPFKTSAYDVKETNIVLIGAKDGYGHRYANSVVVNPDERDPAKKYKMAFYDWHGGDGEAGVAGLCVAFSPDGIHWTRQGSVRQPMSFGAKTMQPPFEDETVYYHLKNPDGREWRQWRYPATLSDGVDVLWDARLQRYVIYGKMWIGGPDGGINWKHAMGRSESVDFLHWSRPQFVSYPDEHDPANLEYHTSPVFIRHGVYLSHNQLFIRENSTIDNELMSSRDGLNWNRTFARQTLIVRGGAKAFDAGFLLTNGNPIEMGDETWFYYGGHRGMIRFANPDEPGMPKRVTQFGSGVGLAKMKRDRFVAIEPDPRISLNNSRRPTRDTIGKPAPTLAKPNTIGQVTLKPRDLSGVKTITLNADAAKGQIAVELLNEDGFRVRGFSKDDAVPVTSDALDAAVAWKGADLSQLKPGRYSIRVHLAGAKLYALTLQ